MRRWAARSSEGSWWRRSTLFLVPAVYTLLRKAPPRDEHPPSDAAIRRLACLRGSQAEARPLVAASALARELMRRGGALRSSV